MKADKERIHKALTELQEACGVASQKLLPVLYCAATSVYGPRWNEVKAWPYIDANAMLAEEITKQLLKGAGPMLPASGKDA